MRKKDAVIYDQFINPQHKYLNIKKIFKTLIKLNYYSSWPTPITPRGDSPYNDSLKKHLLKNFCLSSFYWSSKQKDDVSNFTKNFTKFDNKFSKIYKTVYYSVNGEIIGSIHFNFKENLELLSEIWYIGDNRKKIKELSQVYDPKTHKYITIEDRVIKELR